MLEPGCAAHAKPYIQSSKLAGKFIHKMGTKIQPDFEPEEKIEMEGPANLFRGMEGVGGKNNRTVQQKNS